MKHRIVRTCTAASTLAFAIAAHAQSAPGAQVEPGAPVEEIQVTGTRIVRQGFVAPTPITSMTAQDIKAGGFTELGLALDNLPSAMGDRSTIAGTGTMFAGINAADLRGLGSQRTLVLIDGQRPIFSNSIAVNLDMIPTSLVKRVDVVTGGASAQWGSDAVAGVVNVVLDNDFVGARANFQYGANWKGYGPSYEGDVALGTHFGPDDRGHVMVSGQWTASAYIPRFQVPQMETYYVPNPNYTPTNGQHQYMLVPNAHFTDGSVGGLINSGPLAGTAFGPNGATHQFVIGQYAGSGTMVGGDPDAYDANQFPGHAIQNSKDEKTVFARGSYEVSSALTLRADFMYERYSTFGGQNPAYTQYIGDYTIQNNNAFLPASIKAAMAAKNITSFTMGRSNTDFGGPYDTVDTLSYADTYQGTLGAHGAIAGSWTYDVFYSFGANDTQNGWGPQPIANLFYNAVNSSINPATGQPQCQNPALKNPLTGASCVPVNLFGYGSPSQASLNYFQGTPWRYWSLRQNEAAGTVQGEPFSTWAGPVSVAAGVEWRTEGISQTVDPISAVGGFLEANDAPTTGHYSVAEGFFETVVPLLKDLPGAQEFDFNGAVRESHYSTSGAITSYKVGFTDHATPEILLRGTYSQDIRAPNLNELYSIALTNFFYVVDPTRNNQSFLIESLSGGNPNLKPEVAHTITYGGVYSPDWIPSLHLSLDWWSLQIQNAVTVIDAQTLINYCTAGDSQACKQIIRNGQGQITLVYQNATNLLSQQASGIDFELSHRIDLEDIWHGVPGTLTSHWLATYYDKLTGSDGVVQSNGVAQMNGFSSIGNNLRWRTNFTETYDVDGFSAYLRWRFASGGTYAYYLDLDNNHVAGQGYFDIGASYFLDTANRWQIYANIANVANRPVPYFADSVLGNGFYDIYGRTYNVGIRATF